MKKFIVSILVIIIVLFILGYVIGKRFYTTGYTIKSKKISQEIKVVQLSDFHDEKDKDVITYLATNAKPDIITFTGDLIDDKSDLKSVERFIKDIVEIAPVYYVRGNHEDEAGKYGELKEILKKHGVTILEDEYIDVEINSQKIRIIGINDVSYSTLFTSNFDEETRIKQVLEENIDDTILNLVLVHRPHYFKTYASTEADLILTGHVHGGQIKIPIVDKGILAPDQGFFPEYDYGLYEENNTAMIVSSGLSNTQIIPRLYNPREVVVIKLINEN